MATVNKGQGYFEGKNLLGQILIRDQLRFYTFIAISLLIADILLHLHSTRLIVSNC